MEVWKSITGYENYYEVSNLGRVKSLERIAFSPKLKRKRKLKEKILSPGIRCKCKGASKTGYFFLVLNKEGKSKRFSIHRLVAKEFVENKYDKKVVNHIDEDTFNNTPQNLEWVTTKENCNHGTRNKRIGENHARCKFKEKVRYSTEPSTRSNFKIICKRNNWIFTNFEEKLSEIRANDGHKKYYYKEKEE